MDVVRYHAKEPNNVSLLENGVRERVDRLTENVVTIYELANIPIKSIQR